MHRLILVMAALTSLAACSRTPDPAPRADYDIATAGTRQFEFDTATAPGVIKILLEESNLGSAGVEMAEIFFPPDYHGTTHPHDFEIIYVLEGTLDHIVNGESHLLTPGMVGVVREPDLVVHRTASPDGVRVLVVWPTGGEVAGFEGSGMREQPLPEH
jgi:quercetin dioxygenase-like cupin family protein